MPLILSGDTGVPASGMPTGSVIQTVNFAWTTQDQSTTSTSFVDTGLSATITPISSSSNIIVVISLGYEIGRPATRCLFGYRLLRNATALITAGTNNTGLGTLSGTTSADLRDRLNFQYYDSPATTSALTYKLQVYVEFSNVTLNMNPSGGQSAITLLEIKG